MWKKGISLCIMLFFVFSIFAISVNAQDNTEDENIPEGSPFILNINTLSIWGISGEIGYKIKLFGLNDTKFIFPFGINYLPYSYWRYPDGTVYEGVAQNFTDFKRFELLWGFGIRQGLIFNNEIDYKRNIFEISLLYKGYYYSAKDNGSFLFQTSLPDKNEGNLHIFDFSIDYNSILYDNFRHIFTGIKMEGLLDYAPDFINNYADYYKISFLSVFYIPIVKEFNFVTYIANNTNVSYVNGDKIPYFVYPSLGWFVRGIPNMKYDGKIAGFNNLEIRIIFPEFLDPMFLAGFIIFYDMGFFDNKTLQISQSFHTIGVGFNFTIDLIFINLGATIYGVYNITDNIFTYQLEFSTLGFHF